MDNLNNICWLTCTYGRASKLERNIRCFLDQDYEGYALMYICNTGDVLELSKELLNLPINRKIIIMNIPVDNFSSVGEKYSFAINELRFTHPSIDIVTSADDDDIFLYNHLTEGNKGMNKAYSTGQLAYKPKRSYYRYKEGLMTRIAKQENSLEPSIFVDFKYILKERYAPVSIQYHQKWLDPLIATKKILVDPDGISTLVYNWGDGDIYKMSGLGQDTHNNFLAHKRESRDMGNGILIPTISNEKYYQEIKDFIISNETH